MRTQPGLTRRFAASESAVSAVEFAVILPFMLVLLLGSFDVARAIDIKSKLSILSRTVSDFVSQDQTVTPAQLANIVQASRSVMYPYPFDASVLTVTVDSIRLGPDGESYIIDWSYAPANRTDRPADVTPPDSSVVRTKVAYTYNMKFAGFLFERLGMNQLTLKSETYMAPRWGTPVEAQSFP